MRLSRREFLRYSLISGVGSGLMPSLHAFAGSDADALTGNFRPVHDPCIINEGDTYYLFCTGPRLPLRTSENLVDWELRGDIFRRIPNWAKDEIPFTDSLWAPDIAYFNDQYHLYYSVSTFGSNHSCIGLATSPTLNPLAEDYAWTDHGKVIGTLETDNFNAIDPNLMIDAEGQYWLAFGSFWSGLKMRRIDPQTGKLSTEDETLYSLAQRDAPDAIEAPFIIRHEDYYYLFASFDFCCRGADSTYHVVVGRSEQITGPYLDRDGVSMLEGGGTQITFPTDRWRGPGHCAVLQEDEHDYLVYHAYDNDAAELPTLRISPILWEEDGWLTVGE